MVKYAKETQNLFANKTTSYKYFWALAILRYLKKDKTKISFSDLCIEMLVLSWKPFMVEELSASSMDKFKEHLTRIHEELSIPLSIDLDILRRQLDKEFYDKKSDFLTNIVTKLSQNVPYRFLSPWITYVSENQVIAESKKYSKKYPYTIYKEGIRSSYIEISESSKEWFLKNQKVFFEETKIAFSNWNNRTVTLGYLDNTIDISLSYRPVDKAHEEAVSYLSKQIPFSLHQLIDDIEETHLIYDKKMIYRMVLSLATKPFLILSGLAGSGKTQLALAFSQWIVEDVEKQICFVPVGADWTNRESLLGYANSLELGRYTKPDNGALDLLLRANKNSDKPYFLILDEMNLSYVERYFADFLSAIESHKSIPLIENSIDDEIPSKVSLPPNLFIIGTINVDETTYMFSPKVLDRAQVMEFRILDDEMKRFLLNHQPINLKGINGKGSAQAKSFLEIVLQKNYNIQDEERTQITQLLLKFFTTLKRVNAEFGYRTAHDIFRFIALDENLKTGLKRDELIDIAIIQKLLPKLHGARKKIEPVLKELWKLCESSSQSIPVIDGVDYWDNLIEVRFPLSAEKIWRMYQGVISNGFTSFAEA